MRRIDEDVRTIREALQTNPDLHAEEALDRIAWIISLVDAAVLEYGQTKGRVIPSMEGLGIALTLPASGEDSK